MITSLWVGEPSGGNTDVLVKLEDGRGYAFTAFTPEEIGRLMQAEGLTHFLCEDMLLVKDLQEATIRKAIEDLVENYNLDKYGIRQAD